MSTTFSRKSSTVKMRARWKDYYELCKPNVVLLMMLTSVVGMLLAVPGAVPVDVLILGNLGIALCAASAATINHLVDRGIDQKMRRTFNRPVATGRVQPVPAAIFALTLGLLGMGVLIYFINPLTAYLTLGSLLGYAVVYTLYLKRSSPQNIVIGGLAGAAPPLLGWTAVTGQIDGHALLLVLIIFAWTPPHFWALAVHRKEDYAKADVPMLPVTHGERYTKIHILLYTVILLITTTLPFVTGMLNVFYFVGSLILGAGFLYWAVRLLLTDDRRIAMETFKYSIIYLMALFVIMLIDHYFFPISYP